MLDTEPGFEWHIRDDDIIVYHFKDSRRDSVDKWITMTSQHRDAFIAQGKPTKRMWLFDATVMPTPYAVKKSIQLANDVPEGMSTQVACVMANQHVYALMRYVFTQIEARKDFIRFFDDEVTALAWLQSTDTSTD